MKVAHFRYVLCAWLSRKTGVQRGSCRAVVVSGARESRVNALILGEMRCRTGVGDMSDFRRTLVRYRLISQIVLWQFRSHSVSRNALNSSAFPDLPAVAENFFLHEIAKGADPFGLP